MVISKSDVPGMFCAGADLKEKALMTEDEVAMHTMRSRRVIADLTAELPWEADWKTAMATDIRVAGEVPARTSQSCRDLGMSRFGVQSGVHTFLAGVAWNRTKCKAKL